jgi:urea carboxylase-associated protein 2
MQVMNHYTTDIPGGSHWSLIIRKGMQLTIEDIEGGANLGMLFYNPVLLSEKFNAPDTLKCQHTFRLTTGNCLYSDMGRIFCSITSDDFGWHDSVCGNMHADQVKARWGERSYQSDSNDWHQNGYDSFLVELAKYEMDRTYMAANMNWFSEVSADDEGNLGLSRQASAGDKVVLRFEMDTLVVLHTCPHPLNMADTFPKKPVRLTLEEADPVSEDDACLNHCDENRRGFQNNALYLMGVK